LKNICRQKNKNPFKIGPMKEITNHSLNQACFTNTFLRYKVHLALKQMIAST